MISIVIPFYNSEKYIGECLESVQAQTAEDLEILCIDDGSMDSSARIVEELAGKDARIRLIRKENGGASSARNLGAQQASGEYLYFLDSDDILKPEALEKMRTAAMKNDLDLLLFDGEAFFETEQLEKEQGHYRTYYRRKHTYPEVTEGWEMLSLMVEAKEYRVAPWLQFVNLDFYRRAGISFEEGIVAEDNLSTFYSMTKASRVGYLGECLVRRRVRGGSVMTSETDFHKVYSFFYTYEELAQFFYQGELSLRQQETMEKILDLRLKVARQLYQKLSESEREKMQELPVRERVAFRHLLAIPCDRKKASGPTETVQKERRGLFGKILRG